MVQDRGGQTALTRERAHAGRALKALLARAFCGLRLDDAANHVLERWVYRNAWKRPDGSWDYPPAWRSRRFQILVYHKVSPDPHPYFAPTPPDVFEWQMRFLREHYCPMDLEELVERMRLGDIPQRAVAVTFDDGYRDNYEYAFPVLEKYGLPATIFLATGAIDNRMVLWHDRVFDAFRFATVRRARLRSWDGRELSVTVPALREVLRRAKYLPEGEKLSFVEEIEEALQPAPPGPSAPRMLSWDLVREMHAAGVRFGSHTVRHAILTTLDTEQLRRELHDSRRAIKEELRAPARLFAYPNGQEGDFDDASVTAVKLAGYAGAATSAGTINTLRQDPFLLNRGQPWHRNPGLFRTLFLTQRHGLYRFV